MRLTAAAAVLVAGCSAHSASFDRAAVADVRRRVDVALPVGATRGEVEGWLTERGIEHDFSDLPLLGSSTVNMFPDEGDYSGFVVGVVRPTLLAGTVYLYFVLGKDGRLKRRDVCWVGSGPGREIPPARWRSEAHFLGVS